MSSQTSKQVVFVTRDWAGLGLGILAKRQGSNVIFAYDFKEGDEKDAEATEICGDGLVEKIPLSEAILKFVGQGTLWVFDSNDHANVAQRLLVIGERIIGTSRLSADMEHDRLKAAKIAKSIGMDLPETKEFTDLGEGMKFLESRKNEAFVYKPNESDPTATFVPQEIDDPAKANEVLREYIASLKPEGEVSFILQALIPGGVEANFEIWVRDGKPVVSFLNLESKRKLTGDLGTLIGCAGGYVTKVPFACKGIQQTVAGYLRIKELTRYTGSVDANVVFVKNKIYFLENCFRFGYNAYPEIFYSLANEPIEAILRKWVSGKGTIEDAFSKGFAGSLTLTTDKCTVGCPILVSKSAKDGLYVYQAMEEDGHLMEVGGWPEIACVIAHDETISRVGIKCLDLAKQVAFPNKGHRVDLANSDRPSLPAHRYHSLVSAGLLK